jgi:signal transduction histidine kinase
MAGTKSLIASTENDRLLAYVADLELEVDRLRRQSRFIEHRATETLATILRLCTGAGPDHPLPTLAEVEKTARGMVDVVRDLHDPPGYHPAHDQVVAIAIRPLIEQVFRWQQRLNGAQSVDLRLECRIDHMEWFPARLRHLIDNLFANALRYRDPTAGDSWVSLSVASEGECYEIQVSDNGNGPPPGEDRRILDLFYRAAPVRSAGFGAGLAIVKLLVEQSGGKLSTCARDGGGSVFTLTLPRYDLLDYLE